jgi:hypothetical protein
MVSMEMKEIIFMNGIKPIITTFEWALSLLGNNHMMS